MFLTENKASLKYLNSAIIKVMTWPQPRKDMPLIFKNVLWTKALLSKGYRFSKGLIDDNDNSFDNNQEDDKDDDSLE